jgi:hypothetical protein
MQGWKQKLHDFSEKAEAKRKAASYAAENELNKAWAETKVVSRKLQTTSTEGWESATRSFEIASGTLADA